MLLSCAGGRWERPVRRNTQAAGGAAGRRTRIDGINGSARCAATEWAPINRQLNTMSMTRNIWLLLALAASGELLTQCTRIHLFIVAAMTVRETGRESRRPHRYTPQADDTATKTRCPPDGAAPWAHNGRLLGSWPSSCWHQPVAHVGSSRHFDRPMECAAQCTGRNVSDFCSGPMLIFGCLLGRLAIHSGSVRLICAGMAPVCCAARPPKICFGAANELCASFDERIIGTNNRPSCAWTLAVDTGRGQGRLEVSGERAGAPATRRYSDEVAASRA